MDIRKLRLRIRIAFFNLRWYYKHILPGRMREQKAKLRIGFLRIWFRLSRERLKGDSCDECKSTGLVLHTDVAYFPGAEVWMLCPKCHGTKVINSPNACGYCLGTGSLQKQHSRYGYFYIGECDGCLGSKVGPPFVKDLELEHLEFLAEENDIWPDTEAYIDSVVNG